MQSKKAPEPTHSQPTRSRNESDGLLLRIGQFAHGDSDRGEDRRSSSAPGLGLGHEFSSIRVHAPAPEVDEVADDPVDELEEETERAFDPDRTFAAPPAEPPPEPPHGSTAFPFIQPNSIQPKLIAGDVDDPLEAAADRMADRVLHMQVPSTPAERAAETTAAMPLPTTLGLGTGRPLDEASRAFFEPRFGHDFSRVRIHVGRDAATSAHAMAARAYTFGQHIVFGAGEFAPNDASRRRLLAHELAHAVQQGAPALAGGSNVDSVPATPDGALRRTPEEVEEYVRNPPASRMQASLNGLDFYPAETARFATPDQERSPTAIVLARLAGTAYDPAWVAQVPQVQLTWDFHGRPANAINYFRLLPGGVATVLAFLGARIGQDRIAITAEQRALAVAGEALNPVPPAILAEQRAMLSVYSDPTAGGPNILAQQQAILNSLATMWWGRTQAYVRAFLAWKADPSPDNLQNAALALDELLTEFQPYSALLRIIHDDAALQALPEWRQLWPPRRDGGARTAEQVVASEAVAFARYASSQPRNLISLARRDAVARRSLLEGYGAFRSRTDSRTEGDQQVADRPSPYNAPPLPVTLNTSPHIDPPLFAAATGVTTTFFANIGFDNLIEGMQHAFGGWQYSWEALRVPNDDLASLGITSIPNEPPPGWDAVQQDLGRDFRYARTDLQRIGWISRLMSVFGPPGVNADTLVAANFVMDAAGTVLGHLIREFNRPSSEFDVRFREEGLHLIRLRVGPRLADQAQVAQFRRAPSVAWMPVYARAPRALGEERLRMELAVRSQAEERYEELRRMLAAPVSRPDQAELQREFDELHLGLYGTTLAVLRDQRQRLIQQRTRIENGRATPEDRAVGVAQLTEQITQIGQLIEMREARAGQLGTNALRLPATLVKDSDGTVISLSIEAAQRSASPQRWFVSDLTSPRSGHREATGDGTLAPDYPAEDSILRALKQLLESPSGYGRGYLSVWFSAPLSGPGHITDGRMRGIRIETDEAGIAMHGIESLSTLISIGAVVAAPFTGGASLAILMPVGIIGAIPSAYRLIHRGQMGTLRFDLETAMQVVDIVGAALQLGEIGAGLRAAARVGTRAGLRWAVVEGSLWIAGIGANGLGMLLMGAGLVDSLLSLQGLPPGLKAARMTEIIGNAMLSIGIQAGAHLASRARLVAIREGVDTAAAGADNPNLVRPAAPVVAPPNPGAGRPRGRTEAPSHLTRAVPSDVARTTPLDVDARLRGNTVRVEYRLGANGRVDPNSIRIVASPHATAADIALHVETARTLQAYAGLLGAVHDGIERLRGITGSRTSPEQGSAAWEAQLELAKLNGILRDRLRRVSGVTVDEARAVELASDLQNIADQLAQAQRILAGYDPANPRGFIAADSTEQRSRARIGQANRETVVRLDVATISVGANGQITVRPPSASSTVDPTPGYHFVADRALRRNQSATTEPQLELLQHGGRLYIVPAPPPGSTITGADYYNNFRAQLDTYPPPLPGHVYRPDGDGWQLRHDGVSPLPAQRITTAGGRPALDARGQPQYTNAGERPTFADRQRSAVQTQPPPSRRSAALEAQLTARGVPLDDTQRAILRRWSDTLTELGRIAAESLGRNVQTEAEIAAAAVAELTTRLAADGSYNEGRYDAFRYALREASLAAVFGVDTATMRAFVAGGPAPANLRTPAEQRALYDRLYATLPDNQSRGELWTRYRDARGRLGAAQGGFEGFNRLPLSAGQVIRHNPETMIDGAIQATGDPRPGAPPAGRYGLESKGGGSYNPEQAGRYSDHLRANAGQVVMSDGTTTYAGVVYLFDNQALAARAVRDLRGRHANIYVGYVDASGAVQWVPRTTGTGTGTGTTTR